MNRFLDKKASLTPQSIQIICDKATEAPYSGIYNYVVSQGTYLCRRCGLALFRGHRQFSSGCGWPSFDESLNHTIKEQPDLDGYRTEILCHRCEAHLGHVFIGEQFTAKNRRYCVNAAAIDFVEDSLVIDTEEALLAGGCFWGVDYYLNRLPGVLKIEVGYCGGQTLFPNYEKICQGNTGHYETVRVVFDTAKISYQQVLKRFFEIHDPTQKNGQGPDLGPQYQSAIFYYDRAQYEQATVLIKQLNAKGYDVATRLLNAQIFWPAEDEHQHYYLKNNQVPYCHHPVERFD